MVVSIVMGVAPKSMVYKRKSQNNMDDLGVPLFQETSISGCEQTKANSEDPMPQLRCSASALHALLPGTGRPRNGKVNGLVGKSAVETMVFTIIPFIQVYGKNFFVFPLSPTCWLNASVSHHYTLTMQLFSGNCFHHVWGLIFNMFWITIMCLHYCHLFILVHCCRHIKCWTYCCWNGSNTILNINCDYIIIPSPNSNPGIPGWVVRYFLGIFRCYVW